MKITRLIVSSALLAAMAACGGGGGGGGDTPPPPPVSTTYSVASCGYIPIRVFRSPPWITNPGATRWKAVWS